MSENKERSLDLGRYTLCARLGEGGMAEVFLAELRSTDGFAKVLVLKRILPHLARDQKFVTMFLDEARLASKLSHPNVVTVFDFGEIDGEYFLTMEYLPGESLGSVLQQAESLKQRIPLPIAFEVASSICDGLHYAHELTEHGAPLNIVHRDVTPSNIMLTYQGTVKLLDFGVARAADRQQEQTRTGIVKGKVPYCSPEQLEGLEIDRRSDVFSIGVVLHEMITGRRLFRRDTDLLTMRAILEHPVPPVVDMRPDAPPEIDEVLAKALARDRNERFQNARELRKALDNVPLPGRVRIDEYMVELFGNKRASRAVELSSTIAAEVASDLHRTDSSSGHEPTTPLGSSYRSKDEVVSNAEVRSAASRRKKTPLVLSVLGALLAAVAVGWYTWHSSNPADKPSAGAPAATAQLRVDTLPRGARVGVDEERLPGTTPVVASNLEPGKVVVTATKDGFLPARRVVHLEAGKETNVVLELSKAATVSFDTRDGAKVHINGKDRGEVRELSLEPGKHEIEISLEGYKPLKETIELEAGQYLAVEARLEPLRRSRRATNVRAVKREPGILDVGCIPWCKVFVDGKDIGRTSPIVGHAIPPGKHTLRLEHPPSGKHREIPIEVAPGERIRKRVRF